LLLVVKLNALLIAHWRTVIVAQLYTSRSETLTHGSHWQCLSVGWHWTRQQVALLNRYMKLSSCIRHFEISSKTILTESATSGDSDSNNNIMSFEVLNFFLINSVPEIKFYIAKKLCKIFFANALEFA